MPKNFSSARTVKFLAAFVFLLVLAWFNPRGIFDPARRIVSFFASPFQKVFYLSGKKISGAFYFLSSISELKKENERLVRENDYLTGKTAALSEARAENEKLRRELELSPRKKFNLEAALVIGQNPQKLGNWIMIDKGESRGIEKGMPVVAAEGILIGKVSEVYFGSARVSLLSDSESAVNAVDLETGAKGIVKGEYDLGLMMDLVAQSDVLNEDDLVVTSGLDGDMPKGLLIGKIQETTSSGEKLFQQAFVIPRIRYSKLDIVSVVKN